MIRKSVETRDWLNTIEPRNVRSVMKRMVEEVTLIDKQVGALYKEGAKKDQGSGEPGTLGARAVVEAKINVMCGVWFSQRVRAAVTRTTTVSRKGRDTRSKSACMHRQSCMLVCMC